MCIYIIILKAHLLPVLATFGRDSWPQLRAIVGPGLSAVSLEEVGNSASVWVRSLTCFKRVCCVCPTSLDAEWCRLFSIQRSSGHQDSSHLKFWSSLTKGRGFSGFRHTLADLICICIISRFLACIVTCEIITLHSLPRRLMHLTLK